MIKADAMQASPRRSVRLTAAAQPELLPTVGSKRKSDRVLVVPQPTKVQALEPLHTGSVVPERAVLRHSTCPGLGNCQTEHELLLGISSLKEQIASVKATLKRKQDLLRSMVAQLNDGLLRDPALQ